MALVANCLIRH